MLNDIGGFSMEKFKNPYFLVREKEPPKNTGVNGTIAVYYMPLEEIWEKYGKPGDLNGYEPSQPFRPSITRSR